MEADDELKGEGNSYDFGMRMYDPRVARWFSTDEYEMKYPSHSPYVFALDNPIIFVDPDGAETKPSKIIEDIFGIDLPPLAEGIIDGAWEASPAGMGTFVWDMLTDKDFRDQVWEGTKMLISDPIGTLKASFSDQVSAFDAVLSGNATAEQEYTVGHTTGGTLVGLITGGGFAALFKKLAKPKGKSISGVVDDTTVKAKVPVSDEAVLIGKHKDMRKIKDGKQSHHLNQDAAFRDGIPTNEAVTIKLEGNILEDINSPHYKAHASLEQFWNQYRKGGAMEGKFPTMLEYTKALKKSLEDAGLNKVDVERAVKAAIKDRVKHGLLGGEEVLNLPGRINLPKPNTGG